MSDDGMELDRDMNRQKLAADLRELADALEAGTPFGLELELASSMVTISTDSDCPLFVGISSAMRFKDETMREREVPEGGAKA